MSNYSEKIKSDFPSGIAFPDELGQLCAWVEANGYPVSGYFELREGSDAFEYWFGKKGAEPFLAQFGAGPDGSMYCLWMQPDGRCPVVHMGSEGDNVMVLAPNFIDFLVILAIGYGELGHADFTAAVGDDDERIPKFVDWVESTFGRAVPETAQPLVAEAQQTHDDFEAWVDTHTG